MHQNNTLVMNKGNIKKLIIKPYFLLNAAPRCGEASASSSVLGSHETGLLWRRKLDFQQPYYAVPF